MKDFQVDEPYRYATSRTFEERMTESQKAAEVKRTLEQRAKEWVHANFDWRWKNNDPMDGRSNEDRHTSELAAFGREVLEEAAIVAESTHVLHGDHYASYEAPSSDGKAIAARIRQMKEGW